MRVRWDPVRCLADADDRSIALDCTMAWLSENASRLSLCGVHLAQGDEVAVQGFVANAVVPDDPVPLASMPGASVACLPAAAGTPTGLCVGFDRLAPEQTPVERILAEAAHPGFQPNAGASYCLGAQRGRLVDVLSAPVGVRTTTRFDPRIQQYSDDGVGNWVGMHYDNAITASGEGERHPRRTRLAAAERRALCNIGPGRRSLVVALNMTALQLSDAASPGDGENVPSTRQLRQFLLAEPDRISGIVCLVIGLDPGDIVVFPAGTAMHDGSMLGSLQPSRAIVVAGHFPRRTADVRPVGPHRC